MLDLIVMGASLGGLAALKTILRVLPSDFKPPLVVVQHRTRDAGDALQRLLQEACALPVREAEDKQEIHAGHVYLAPAGYHLLIEPGRFALSLEEPEEYALPSIDILFESAATVYGAGVMGVLLTGSGRDGAKGLLAVKTKGGITVVESPETAVDGSMPQAAISLKAPHMVMPLETIGTFLADSVR